MRQIFNLPHDLTTPTERLVLLGIAEQVRAGKEESWPGVDTIAMRTSLSRKSVMRAISSLEAKGLIAVERSNGRSNRYRFNLSHGGTGETPQPVPPCPQTSPTVGLVTLRDQSQGVPGPVPPCPQTSPTVSSNQSHGGTRTTLEPVVNHKEAAATRARARVDQDSKNGSGIVFVVHSGQKRWDMPASLIEGFQAEFPTVDVGATLQRLADWTEDERPKMGAARMPSWLRSKLAEESQQDAASREHTGKPSNGRYPVPKLLTPAGRNMTKEEMVEGFFAPRKPQNPPDG